MLMSMIQGAIGTSRWGHGAPSVCPVCRSPRGLVLSGQGQYIGLKADLERRETRRLSGSEHGISLERAATMYMSSEAARGSMQTANEITAVADMCSMHKLDRLSIHINQAMEEFDKADKRERTEGSEGRYLGWRFDGVVVVLLGVDDRDALALSSSLTRSMPCFCTTRSVLPTGLQATHPNAPSPPSLSFSPPPPPTPATSCTAAAALVEADS